MWTHVDNWSKAAEALSVSVSGPLIFELERSSSISVDMLVRDFGVPRGTAVCTSYESIRPYISQMREAGYTFSSFGPGREGYECSRADLIEILSE
jgi:hypothetical protein